MNLTDLALCSTVSIQGCGNRFQCDVCLVFPVSLQFNSDICLFTVHCRLDMHSFAGLRGAAKDIFVGCNGNPFRREVNDRHVIV